MAMHQRLGIGQAHVLGGEAHQAARDVEGVLARLQHAGQPVEPGVGVGVADRLVQRADDVEVLLARAVVEQRLAREGLPHGLQVHGARRPSASGAAVVTAISRTLSAVRASPSEAGGQEVEGVVGRPRRRSGAEAALARRRGPAAARRRAAARPSGFSTTTRQRERSAAFTSNDGFSVVAPMSTTSPDSTCASSASCWALL